MKVICIDDRDDGDSYDGTRPVMGEIYTVVRRCVGYDKSGRAYRCYELAEFPRGIRDFDISVFDVWRFIPLSNNDERERRIQETMKH